MNVTFNGKNINNVANVAKEDAAKFFPRTNSTGEVKAVTNAIDNIAMTKEDAISYAASHSPIQKIEDISADKLAEAYKAANGIK